MTKEAEKIQDVLDTIESIERMEDENGELTLDEQKELEILEDTLKGMGQICGECEGTGDCADLKRINSTTIDPPRTHCPECFGSGVL